MSDLDAQMRELDESVRKHSFTQRAISEETGITQDQPERGSKESRSYWNIRLLTHRILGVHYRTPQFNLELLTQHINSRTFGKSRVISWAFVVRADDNLRFETPSARISFSAADEIDPTRFLNRFGIELSNS